MVAARTSTVVLCAGAGDGHRKEGTGEGGTHLHRWDAALRFPLRKMLRYSLCRSRTVVPAHAGATATPVSAPPQPPSSWNTAIVDTSTRSERAMSGRDERSPREAGTVHPHEAPPLLYANTR